MNRVSFDEVEDIFNDIWCDSKEQLFHEIAWDCLEKAGLTTYSDDKTYAQIYVYAYVIQMLCDEFSYMAYDELCVYEYEVPEEEPLTDAAIGWLYRDAICKYDNASQCFSMNADEMLLGIMEEYRYKVADAIFDQLGDSLVGALLYFSIQGTPQQENDDENEPEYFHTTDDLLKYCKSLDFYFLDLFREHNAMQVQHWLDCHSCAIDD